MWLPASLEVPKLVIFCGAGVRPYGEVNRDTGESQEKEVTISKAPFLKK